MSTRCEDVTARLLELLYDELPADERAALEAHVAGCERCRAEVDSFQKTRAMARRVLAEPPPKGVRERLLAAATAASASAAPAVVVQAKAAAPAAPVRARAEVPGTDARAGFWAWLRQHWTMPTLATVGAMAVFLLASRIFLSPEKTYQRGQAISGPPPAPTATAPVETFRPEAVPPPSGAPLTKFADEPAAAKGAAPGEPRDQAPPRASAHRATGGAAGAGAGSAGAPGIARALGSSAVDRQAKRGRADDLFGGGQQGLGAGKAGKKDVADNPLEGLGGLYRAPARPAPAKVAAPEPRARLAQPFPAVPEEEKSESGVRGAQSPTIPPAGAAGAAAGSRAPAPSAAAAPVAPAPPAAAAPVAPAPPAAAAPMPTAAPSAANASAPSPRRMRASAEAEAAADASESDRRATVYAAKPKSRAREESLAQSSAHQESLPQRAERLFKEGHWPQAAAAFEQLLRQFPDSPLVPRWRQRLAAARAAEQTTAEPTPSP